MKNGIFMILIECYIRLCSTKICFPEDQIKN